MSFCPFTLLGLNRKVVPDEDEKKFQEKVSQLYKALYKASGENPEKMKNITISKDIMKDRILRDFFLRWTTPKELEEAWNSHNREMQGRGHPSEADKAYDCADAEKVREEMESRLKEAEEEIVKLKRAFSQEKEKMRKDLAEYEEKAKSGIAQAERKFEEVRKVADEVSQQAKDAEKKAKKATKASKKLARKLKEAERKFLAKESERKAKKRLSGETVSESQKKSKSTNRREAKHVCNECGLSYNHQPSLSRHKSSKHRQSLEGNNVLPSASNEHLGHSDFADDVDHVLNLCSMK